MDSLKRWQNALTHYFVFLKVDYLCKCWGGKKAVCREHHLDWNKDGADAVTQYRRQSVACLKINKYESACIVGSHIFVTTIPVTKLRKYLSYQNLLHMVKDGIKSVLNITFDSTDRALEPYVGWPCSIFILFGQHLQPFWVFFLHFLSWVLIKRYLFSTSTEIWSPLLFNLKCYVSSVAIHMGVQNCWI